MASREIGIWSGESKAFGLGKAKFGLAREEFTLAKVELLVLLERNLVIARRAAAKHRQSKKSNRKSQFEIRGLNSEFLISKGLVGVVQFPKKIRAKFEFLSQRPGLRWVF